MHQIYKYIIETQSQVYVFVRVYVCVSACAWGEGLKRIITKVSHIARCHTKVKMKVIEVTEAFSDSFISQFLCGTMTVSV